MSIIFQGILNNIYVMFTSLICMHIVLMILDYLIEFATKLFNRKGV